MSEQDNSVELETVEMEHHLTMGEALERLRDNPDFQLVIEKGYLNEKVRASVSLLAVPQIKAEGRRGDLMEDLVAASNLEYYLRMVENFYAGAKDPILSDEEEADLEAEDGAE